MLLTSKKLCVFRFYVENKFFAPENGEGGGGWERGEGGWGVIKRWNK